jgi:hypothetical protein
MTSARKINTDLKAWSRLWQCPRQPACGLSSVILQHHHMSSCILSLALGLHQHNQPTICHTTVQIHLCCETSPSADNNTSCHLCQHGSPTTNLRKSHPSRLPRTRSAIPPIKRPMHSSAGMQQMARRLFASPLGQSRLALWHRERPRSPGPFKLPAFL